MADLEKTELENKGTISRLDDVADRPQDESSEKGEENGGLLQTVMFVKEPGINVEEEVVPKSGEKGSEIEGEETECERKEDENADVLDVDEQKNKSFKDDEVVEDESEKTVLEKHELNKDTDKLKDEGKDSENNEEGFDKDGEGLEESEGETDDELADEEEDENQDKFEESDNDSRGDEIFADDVNNLYAAYQSVLATDSTDLDPLDTSVLEDPHADLPPISEDDELEMGEFSETMMTQSTGHSGFSDSKLQTVLPFSPRPKALSSDSEMGTDELLCKRIEFDTLELSKDGRDVSQNEDVGSGELLQASGCIGVDTLDSKSVVSEMKGVTESVAEMTETVDSGGENSASQSEEKMPGKFHLKSPSQECGDHMKEVTVAATLELPEMPAGSVSGQFSQHQEQEMNASEKAVVQEVKVQTVTETVTEEVTEVTPSDEKSSVGDTDSEISQSATPTGVTSATVSATGTASTEVPGATVAELNQLDSENYETADSDFRRLEVEPVDCSKCQDVHSEAKYDSGCETERSEEAGVVTSIGEDTAKTSNEGVVENPTVCDSLPTKEYPDFINVCEEKLHIHYVSCYAKEAPIDWFHVPSKPTHRIFSNINLIEKNGQQHKKHLTFDRMTFEPGLRILIEGRAGMGKSTLVHRIAYDYGLGIVTPLKRFKLVFVLDVLKWSRDQELHDVILEQVVQADSWGIDPQELFDWMDNNPEDVAFVIDGLDEHPGFASEHSLLSLAQGDFYSNSSVIFTTQPNRVVEITECCHKSYIMQKFTEKQIHDFVDNFMEEKDIERDKLKDILKWDKSYSEFYTVPLHLAILCSLVQNDEVMPTDPLPTSLTELFNKVFVYILRQLVADRRVDSQKELELSMFEDMAFVLTRLALSCLQDDIVSLSKTQLSSEQEIDDDLLEQFLHYGLLEKVDRRDAYFFPYKLFQEFLAAKFIAIEYFSAANSGQIGVVQDMKHVTELFDVCWACYAEGYKYENLCIFTSGLLTQDYNLFVDALRRQYDLAPDDAARETCLNVACACISENSKNRGFISLVVDSLSPKGDLKLNLTQDDTDGPCLLGLSHMIAADKLPKLSLVNYNPSDTSALASMADAIAETIRLHSLEIDFTNLDPTVGTPKTKDGMEDFSVLKHFVKSISLNSSIRDLGFSLNVDMMCLQGVEVVSGLFLNALSDLRSLSIHVYFKNTSTYFQDCPVIKDNIQSYENLNLLVSRFAVFLQNNPMLEKLELNGCFLHKDALPELKNKIIQHPYLKAFSIAGQKEGAPLHREGTNALAEILHYRNFEEVSINLNSFLPPKVDKYSIKYQHILFDKIEFENELIIAKLLRAMQGNGNLKCVKFFFHQIDCDLLDYVADFVEECISLKQLEIACDDMDDLFMLFLGCGILCSVTLESLTLHGNFNSGGAAFLLIQSCIMSLSLRTVTLDGSFTQDCIDWLAVSLPNLNIHSIHPMTLTLQGQLEDTDPDSIYESVEQLKDCVLPLDLLLETDFK